MAAGYKDFVAGAALAAADLEDYCELQSVMRFASAAARTTALSGVLTEGLMCYLIDTNVVQVYTGSAWSTVGPVHGALTSWTPTVTQSGSVTVTVTAAYYQRVGRWVQGGFELSVTGSGSASNAVVLSVPVTAAGAARTPVGGGQIYDTSAATNIVGILCLGSTTTFDIRHPSNVADNRLGVVSFTAGLASGDLLYGNFAYLAAADA